MSKALVLMSGGLDSLVCLVWAKRNFNEVATLTFDWGQKNKIEIEAAKQLCKNVGVTDTKVIEIPFLPEITDSGLTNPDKGTSKIVNGVPEVQVEGRNMLFLTIGAIYGKLKGITDLVIGSSEANAYQYPDSTYAFTKSAEASATLAMSPTVFTFHVPLMFLTKKEVWALAYSMGCVPKLTDISITCYEGIPGDGCGKCLSCQLRNRGKKEFFLGDK